MKPSIIIKKLLPQLTISALTILVGTIVIQAQVINPYVDARFTNYQTLSLYDQTEFDYIVYKPSFTQIEELKNRPDVSAVVPYFEFAVQINNQSTFTKFIAFEPDANLELTFFNQNRLLFSQESTESLTAIVEENLFASLGGDINSPIVMNVGGQNLSYSITEVYERNPLYIDSGSGFNNGVFAIQYDASFRNLIEGILDYVAYEGAFVKTSNSPSFYDFLTTENVENRYKPYGLVEPRENYETEDSYLAALFDVENFDYRQNNFYKDDAREEWVETANQASENAKNVSTQAYLILALLGFFSTAIIIVFLALNNTQNLVINFNKSPLKVAFLPLMMTLISSIGIYLFSQVLIALRINQYTFFPSKINIDSQIMILPTLLFFFVHVILLTIYLIWISKRNDVKLSSKDK
jgi:hypothetical protein